MTHEGIKVVFCDLDGTLFTPDAEGHCITADTAAAVRRLQEERGVKFIACTGRPYPDVFLNLAHSGIQPDLYITSNGARIHDKNREPVYKINMDPAVALDLLQLPCTPTSDGRIVLDASDAASGRTSLEPRRFIANVNREDEWLTDKCLPEVRAVFHPDFLYQQVDPASVTVERLEGTHSMWLRGEEPVLACVDAYVQRTYAGRVKSKFALPFVLDVFPTTVDKGLAVRRVCEDMLNVSLSDAAAFGDGWNDEPMLACVGHPFLMGNAPQALKAALPQARVVGSNTAAESGVATTLHEILFSHP